MTIKEFLGILREAVATGRYPFHFEKGIGVRYYFSGGPRTPYYTHLLLCKLSEPSIWLRPVDAVISYIADEPFVAEGAEQACDLLDMSLRDLNKIVRASSEIDIYEKDGTFYQKFSRNLRRDLLKAVGLHEIHSSLRGSPAVG